MCSATHASRRSGRSRTRVRPNDDPSYKPAPASPRHREKGIAARTTSTKASSSSSYRSGSFRESRSDEDRTNIDARLQDLHKKICPVTGRLSNVAAHYHITEAKLGNGHYGCVRECIHRQTRKIYACKSIDKSKIRRLDHVRREVHLLSKMRHHGIMNMVDCYEDPHYVHIVTEKYTGGELFDKISQVTTPTGCFSEHKAARIIKTLLEAVAYLHDHDIVHRDIKPENILFESDREDSAVKLIDFGLSRKHRPGEAPMSNPVGTAYYMSPELLRGQYDKSCDMWSIGTIAYILLCGYPPFNGETDPDIFDAIKVGHFVFPSQAWRGKSDLAKDFIKSLLIMDPRDRLTAKEALMHPWIRRMTRQYFSDASPASQHDDMMTRIQTLRQSIQKLKTKSIVYQN